MIKNPKVTIVTVCFNSEKYIEDTIKSVLNQSYKNIEYIIIDGASRDNTLKIINKYKDNFGNRLKVISQKDNGIYDAMNKGISHSTGEIIGLINSDDYLANEYIIEKVVKNFIKNSCDLVYGDLEFIDNNNPSVVVRKWRSGIYKEKMFKKGWCPPHPTLYMKKAVYDSIGLFSLNYKIAADYDLMLRLFEIYKPKVSYLKEVMVKMRIGGVSTRNFRSKIINKRECAIAWSNNGLKKPFLFDFIRIIRKIPQFLIK